MPLLAALAANAAAQSFLLVVLPGLGRELGFTGLQTGAMLGVGALFLMISAPFWGAASETRGRKPILVIGLVGAAIGPGLTAAIIALRVEGAVGAGFALLLMFCARLLQSLLSGGLLPAAQAWMADITSSENRAEGMGLLGGSYGLGAIGGAAVALGFGGSHPAMALGLLAALIGLGLVFVLLALEHVASRERRPHAMWRDLVLARIWPGLLITALGVCVFAIMQHVTALRLEDSFQMVRSDAISSAGGILMCASFAMILTQAFGVRALRALPPVLMLAGSLIAVMSMLMVGSAATIPALFASMVGMGIGLGLLLPGNLAFLSFVAGAHAQGRLAGVNAIAQGIGLAAGPVLGSILHRQSPDLPGFVAAFGMALALCLSIMLRWRRWNDRVS